MALQPGDQQHVLAKLIKAGKLSELAEVTTYKGTFEGKDGGLINLTVEIHDSGPGAGPNRFWVTATDERGVTVTGNPEGSLEDTIDLVHWNELRI